MGRTLRHLEGLDAEPVHATFQHVLNILEVLPQERHLRSDAHVAPPSLPLESQLFAVSTRLFPDVKVSCP